MRNAFILAIGLLFIIGLIAFFSFKQGVNHFIPKPSPTPKDLRGTSPNPVESAPNTSGTQETKFPFPVLEKSQIKGKEARISTNKGDIFFAFLEEAPISSSNFIYLAQKGFYNGLKFHKRIDDSVIEGGDPNGNGTGGPGYTYMDEPIIATYSRGAVAMSSAGPNTNGSQFFILLADQPNHSKTNDIFGYIVQGMEVADQIQPGDIMNKVTIEEPQSATPAGPAKP